MHSCDLDVSINKISKIEGHADLDIEIRDGKVKNVFLKVMENKRFFSQAVQEQSYNSVPQLVSRICGTCSIAHLTGCIEAIEKALDIKPTEQTMILRKLTMYSLMIRDHALHLYFFVLPDILGVDSIIDISDDDNDIGHILLHDSFDIKKIGTDITDVIIGAAIHAPYPTPGGFLKLPDPSKFPDLINRLEAVRPQVLRGIETFFNWNATLIRNSDYLCLRNDKTYDFIEGDIINSHGKRVTEEHFHDFLKSVVIPYSQAEGYVFSDVHKDYLVGALARMNFNKDLLNERTKKSTEKYLSVFPSNNVHHNNLAQAIEILHCVDNALDILRSINIVPEKPIRKPLREGMGVGVIEAPRGILYHMAKINDKGMIEDYDVIVPTAQNQINIENDLKKYFNENLDKNRDTLRFNAEKIIRAYDPCMTCAVQ